MYDIWVIREQSSSLKNTFRRNKIMAVKVAINGFGRIGRSAQKDMK